MEAQREEEEDEVLVKQEPPDMNEFEEYLLKNLRQEELKNPTTERVFKFLDEQLQGPSEEKLLGVEAVQVVVEEGEGHDQGRGGCRGEGKAVRDRKSSNCGNLRHRMANCETKTESEIERNFVGEYWGTETEEELEILDEYVLEDTDNKEDECHIDFDINATETKTFTAEAEGAAGMDSCCSRTLMGKKWFNSYKELAPRMMLKGIKGPEESNVSFTFGNGGKMFSSGRYTLPVLIHGQKITLSVELVNSDIPLLLSKSTMQKCGVVLDFALGKVTAFGITQNMKMTSIGHPIIRVLPRDNVPFLSDVMIVEENQGGS